MSLHLTTINAETTQRHIRKYESRNPVHQWVLHRFHLRVRNILDALQPSRILDFGCGEAYFWLAQERLGPLPEVVGIDLRADAIQHAKTRLPGMTFLCEDLFSLDAGDQQFDLVLASEVLEHLYDPGVYVDRLCAFTSEWLLFTVPHEPFFRLANLVRGRDITRLGNHPEHVQHWSPRTFARFLARHIEVLRVESSFPFIIAVCRKPKDAHSNRK